MMQDESGQSRRQSFCDQCGTQLEPDARFCLNCGTPVGSADISVASEPTSLGHSLQPVGMGDILSKTLLLIKQNPLLFIGIGLLPQVVFFISAFLPLPFIGPFLPGFPGQDGEFLLPSLGIILMWVVLLVVVALVMTFVAEGATIYGVGVKELKQPISLITCFSQGLRKTVVLILGALLLTVVIFLLFLPLLLLAFISPLVTLFLAIPWILFLVVSLWFYPQAIIIEGRGPVSALLRSRKLVKGNWWRVFGIGVVYVIIYFILGILGGLIIVTPLSLLSPALGQFVSVLASALYIPWVFIGSTLLYFDLRVRNEGYTAETLSSEIGLVPRF